MKSTWYPRETSGLVLLFFFHSVMFLPTSSMGLHMVLFILLLLFHTSKFCVSLRYIKCHGEGAWVLR